MKTSFNTIGSSLALLFDGSTSLSRIEQAPVSCVHVGPRVWTLGVRATLLKLRQDDLRVRSWCEQIADVLGGAGIIHGCGVDRHEPQDRPLRRLVRELDDGRRRAPPS